MKKYILIILAFSFFATNSFSQCNDKLVEIAAKKNGENAVYIQNFKARLKKIKKNSNPPIASFTVLLSKGAHYRLNIETAKEFAGKGILQLFAETEMIGSTFHPTTGKNYKNFDFICKKTAIYKIHITFMDGLEGCAVGILSIVRGEQRQINASNIGINGKSLGYISKNEIIENPYLRLNEQNDSVKIKEFSVFYSGGNILKSNSAQFTDEQLKAVRKMKPSEKLIISDVKIEEGSESYYLTRNLEFEIIGVQNDKNIILYTNNENMIEITSTEAGNENLEVTLDKGKIEGDKGKYSIWIEETGIGNMFIITKNAKGAVIETDTIKFQAIEIKSLSAKLFGQAGGIIKKEATDSETAKLEIGFENNKNSTDYEILSFYISKNRQFMKGVKSETSRINNRQRKFIQDLNSGDVFYIKDIRVRTPLNNIIRLSDLGFIVE